MVRPRRAGANYRAKSEEPQPEPQPEVQGGRGRGRGGRGCGGGRGRGRGRGHGEYPRPNLADVIAQTVTNSMPTIVAQVQATLDGNNGVQPNEHQNVGNPENVNDGGAQPHVVEEEEEEEELERADDYRARYNQHGVYRQGCQFKDFKNCGAPEFDGLGGPVECIKWFERIEAMIERSHCTYDDRIYYAFGMFKEDALIWWNQEKALGWAHNLEWADFKNKVKEKFCPPYELQILTIKFVHLKMDGADYKGYVRRFQELSTLVPHLVSTESRAIEKFVLDLTPQVRSLINPIEAINRAGSVTEDLLRSGVLSKSSSSSKRKEVGETSGPRKMGRFDPKNANRGRVMAAVEPVKKPYVGPHPHCGRCNRHHPANGQCGACFNCNRLGHMAKECRVPRVGTGPLNVAPVQALPYQGN